MEAGQVLTHAHGRGPGVTRPGGLTAVHPWAHPNSPITLSMNPERLDLQELPSDVPLGR